MSTNGKRPPGRRMSLFAIDVEAEEKGVEEQLTGSLDWCFFTLRSGHCDDFQDWMMQENMRQTKLNRNVKLDARAESMIFRRAVGEKLIVGWSGLLDDASKPVAFSRELAREIMVDRKWRKYATKISEIVLERMRDHAEEDAIEGKASESSSDTAS